MAEQTGAKPAEPLYGGYSRFELELEVRVELRMQTHTHIKLTIDRQFVQSLANPAYISHLASQKYLDDPAFIRYLDYLQYFREPKYTRYLSWPGATLKALELLQQPKFREEIRLPELVYNMMQRNVDAAWETH